jgi:hypothetical protein
VALEVGKNARLAVQVRARLAGDFNAVDCFGPVDRLFPYFAQVQRLAGNGVLVDTAPLAVRCSAGNRSGVSLVSVAMWIARPRPSAVVSARGVTKACCRALPLTRAVLRVDQRNPCASL